MAPRKVLNLFSSTLLSPRWTADFWSLITEFEKEFVCGNGKALNDDVMSVSSIEEKSYDVTSIDRLRRRSVKAEGERIDAAEVVEVSGPDEDIDVEGR